MEKQLSNITGAENLDFPEGEEASKALLSAETNMDFLGLLLEAIERFDLTQLVAVLTFASMALSGELRRTRLDTSKQLSDMSEADMLEAGSYFSKGERLGTIAALMGVLNKYAVKD